MNIRDLTRQLKIIQIGMEERKKALEQLRAGELTPEAVIRASQLEAELAILGQTYEKLSRQLEEARRAREELLPRAEAEYVDACLRQRELLGKIVKTARDLLAHLKEFSKSIEVCENLYRTYFNLAYELQRTTVHRHLAGLGTSYPLINIVEQLVKWGEEVLSK